MLSPQDYYRLAQVASRAIVEHNQRLTNQKALKSICC